VEHSSTQQAFIDARAETVWELVGDPNRHPDWWPRMLEVECADLHEGCRYRGVVKGFLGAEEHDLVIERLDTCQEVCISCQGTGVTTRFVLTEAQGGTFVEGRFSIEPDSIGARVVSAVSGRRLMRTWLERSLENLKRVAEQIPAAHA
jgi:polyketide cyclase/dehydrase/lipid transport protein